MKASLSLYCRPRAVLWFVIVDHDNGTEPYTIPISKETALRLSTKYRWPITDKQPDCLR